MSHSTPFDSVSLPYLHARDLAAIPPQETWLIDDLWGVHHVGVLGGAPKTTKTWLGLDMAISVASGTPCLGRFRCARSGTVLLYAAEDSEDMLRHRIDCLCASRALSLPDIPVYVITEPALRLDLPSHQQRLSQTLASLKPELLVLDPFVRLHRQNENDAGAVSAILGYLRELQRHHWTAIALVHHTRKNGSSASPGNSLRGSSDVHAWGDDMLYLRREDDHLVLTIEHRSCKSLQPVTLRLVDGDAPHLEVINVVPRSRLGIDDAILSTLSRSGTPLTRTALRDQLRIRNQDLGLALEQLERASRITSTPSGWRLA
jgi:hypothetical protein